MKFETIIFLVIAFNVISALLKRRAKKSKAAKESAGKPGRIDPRNIPVSRETDGDLETEKAPLPQIRIPNPRPQSRGKNRGLGQDILDQLAKELGLRLPDPVPEPVIRKKESQAVPAASQMAAPPSRADSTPEEASKPIVHAAVATVQRRTVMDLPLEDLRDPKRVRAALVLREILNPPVALRRN